MKYQRLVLFLADIAVLLAALVLFSCADTVIEGYMLGVITAVTLMALGLTKNSVE